MTSDQKRDDGQSLDNHETCGGFNRFEVVSLLQKSVRRSDREKAIWAAYELCRSGYDWNFWDRALYTLVEDLRLPPTDAHVTTAVQQLHDLANEKWDPDEEIGIMAAMRAASILAEAESSHELPSMMGYWEGIARDRLESIENGKTPDQDFPVKPGFRGLEQVVHDKHTYQGKRDDKGLGHFLVVSSRTSEMSDLERQYKQHRMTEVLPYQFTDEQIEQAVTPTEEQETSWDDRQVSYPRG